MRRRKNANSHLTTLCLNRNSIKEYRELGIKNLSEHIDALIKVDIERIKNQKGVWVCSNDGCQTAMAFHIWQKNNFICPSCKCDHYTRNIMKKIVGDINEK